MDTQASIRKRIQQQRLALNESQIKCFSQAICKQIIESGILRGAQRIGIYLPVRGEADPTLLRDLDALSGKQFYLPILSEVKANHLAFAEYTSTTTMRQNKFNIPEPMVAERDLIHDPQILDVVITPLVAVDPLGNRIGMGGGFYDRTFAYKKIAPALPPRLVAFAYDFQLITQQTPQSWDVPVDNIALPTQFISP